MSKVWTKEEIKIAFNKFHEINNRTPVTTEMRKVNGLPSWKHVTEVCEIKSVNEFFNSIGLTRSKTTTGNKIPEDIIKNECIRIFSILNRLPKKWELEQMCSFSTHPFYNYGGIRKTFEYFGIYKEYVKTSEERINDSICEIIRLSNELKKSPTVYEYDSMRTMGLTRRVLEKNLGISWNDILSIHSKYPVNVDKEEYGKKEIENALQNFKNKLGRTPKVLEIRKKNVGYGCDKILQTFNITTIAEIYPILGWELFGSDIYLIKEDELLENFKSFVDKNGRLPSSSEYNKGNNLFSKVVYEKRYDSIENLCGILDINYKSMVNSCGAGTICYDKNGELCKSMSEMNITNFLIDMGIKYTKESSYDEFFENDNRRFDWRITHNNVIYHVEFFGLYRTKPIRKFEVNYYNKTNIKINDLDKSNNSRNCVFIFPNQYFNEEYKNMILNKIGIK